MSGYTLSNLKQVDDSAVAFGLAPALEARFAREALECEKTGLSYQRLAADATMSFAHRHAEDEEVYVVIYGSGRARLGDTVGGGGEWDEVRLAAGRIWVW